MMMEFSAPFVSTYWPYISSCLAGIFIIQLITRLLQPKATGYTVDVDPIKPNDIASTPPSDPLGFRITAETSTRYMPYPWFDDRIAEDEMERVSAEFYEKMNKRRSVRKISDEDIPFKVVENIIKTAGKY